MFWMAVQLLCKPLRLPHPYQQRRRANDSDFFHIWRFFLAVCCFLVVCCCLFFLFSTGESEWSEAESRRWSKKKNVTCQNCHYGHLLSWLSCTYCSWSYSISLFSVGYCWPDDRIYHQSRTAGQTLVDAYNDTYAEVINSFVASLLLFWAILIILNYTWHVETDR